MLQKVNQKSNVQNKDGEKKKDPANMFFSFTTKAET